MKNLPQVFLLYLFIFFFSISNAQENPLAKNGFGIETIFNQTENKTIIRHYPERIDVDVFSKLTTGVEFRLNYFRVLNDRWGLETGAVYGVYGDDHNVNLSAEFLGETQDFSSDFGNRVEIYPYWGTNVGFNHYLITKNPKNLFALSAKLNLLWFEEVQSGSSVGLTSGVLLFQATQDDFFYSQETHPNAERKLLLAPELGFSYLRKWGRHFWVKFSVSGTYSSTKPIRGTFTVRGVDEVLTGNFNKRFTHIGVGISLIFSPKWLWEG